MDAFAIGRLNVRVITSIINIGQNLCRYRFPTRSLPADRTKLILPNEHMPNYASPMICNVWATKPIFQMVYRWDSRPTKKTFHIRNRSAAVGQFHARPCAPIILMNTVDKELSNEVTPRGRYYLNIFRMGGLHPEGYIEYVLLYFLYYDFEDYILHFNCFDFWIR